MRCLFIALGVFISALVPFSFSVADSGSSVAPKVALYDGPTGGRMPEKVLLHAMQQIRIPPDSKFFPMYKKSLEQRWREEDQVEKVKKEMSKLSRKEQEKRYAEMVDEMYTEKPIPPLSDAEIEFNKPPVIASKHIRASKGIAFGSWDKLKQQLMPNFDRAISDMKLKSEAEAVKFKKRGGDTRYTTPKLGRCNKNVTHSDRNKSYSDADWQEKVFDMIFLPAESAPRDPDEYFGRNTVVRLYKPESQDYGSMAILSMGVTCLPYRIRGLKGAKYRHEGEDALRNYDADPAGKGKMHEYVNEQIERFMP